MSITGVDSLDASIDKANHWLAAVARRHMTAGAIDGAFALLPADLRGFIDVTADKPAPGAVR